MYLAGGNYDAYTNPQSSFGRGRNPISGGQFGQSLMGRQKRDRSLDFKNVTPERMQKAEEERRKYLESNSGVDKHNLADDIYNFMSTQPGDTGHVTTGLPRLQPIMMTGAPSGKERGGGLNHFNAAPLGPPQEIMPGGMQSQPMPQPFQDRRARMDIHLAPPTRPSMENPSGSLGGQIIAGPTQRGDFGMGIQAPPSSRPNPYSAPSQIGGGFGGQMGGGMGGGQGMGQFMQFMQTMMQMFQQFQGGGGRGMGGGFGGPSPFMPQQQQYGQYQPQQQIRTRGPDSMMQPLRTQRMSNQFNPNNAFGGY
jgi:hypothetical protein